MPAGAVAALSHPNILPIFDFGTHDGVAYAVMELLEGETLRGRLEAGPFSEEQVVELALQVARGLAAAHEKGVVHRDLKPENPFARRPRCRLRHRLQDRARPAPRLGEGARVVMCGMLTLAPTPPGVIRPCLRMRARRSLPISD